MFVFFFTFFYCNCVVVAKLQKVSGSLKLSESRSHSRQTISLTIDWLTVQISVCM